MRYQESKEQSAELLRKVLALMGQHDAAFNPVSFTVWYEVAAGMNVPLVQAVAQAMKTEPRLSTVTLFQLYSEFVADAGPGAIQHIAGELQRMMAGLADNASSTSERAGTFGEQLAGLTEALAAQDTTLLTPQVSEALAGTALMRASAQALAQQIMDSRQEIERLQSELTRVRDEVVMDPLTKVLNRRGFDQQMARLFAEPAVPGCEHCLVMLDIDHFKKDNDTHGHVMGDRVIQALGEVLRACVPDKAHSVARYGGEEFAILLPNCSLHQGIKVADTVRQRARAMKIRDRKTQEVVLTVSISGGGGGAAAGRRCPGLDCPRRWRLVPIQTIRAGLREPRLTALNQRRGVRAALAAELGNAATAATGAGEPGGQGTSARGSGWPMGAPAWPSFTAAMSCGLGYWPSSQ